MTDNEGLEDDGKKEKRPFMARREEKKSFLAQTYYYSARNVSRCLITLSY